MPARCAQCNFVPSRPPPSSRRTCPHHGGAARLPAITRAIDRVKSALCWFSTFTSFRPFSGARVCQSEQRTRWRWVYDLSLLRCSRCDQSLSPPPSASLHTPSLIPFTSPPPSPSRPQVLSSLHRLPVLRALSCPSLHLPRSLSYSFHFSLSYFSLSLSRSSSFSYSLSHTFLPSFSLPFLFSHTLSLSLLSRWTVQCRNG